MPYIPEELTVLSDDVPHRIPSRNVRACCAGLRLCGLPLQPEECKDRSTTQSLCWLFAFAPPGRAQEISRQYVQTLYHGEERDLSAYNRLLDGRPHVVIRDEQSQ